MTSTDKRLFEELRKRVVELEQKLSNPDWEHVNNPVAYCQGAYKRVTALENEVERRVHAGINVRARLTKLESRTNRLDTRACRMAERVEHNRDVFDRRVLDTVHRAKVKECSDLREALCAIATGVSAVAVIGFAVYGVVTLISKFV